MVVGESLLNDGAALALFIMFSDWIRVGGELWAAEKTTLYFVKFVFISPFLGAAFGLVTVLFMSFTNKRMLPEDNIMQISLTICCAYLSFYVAQHVLQISGALACCVAGFVLARYANPLILNVESMRSVWEAMEWFGNTLIFVLAGLIIGSGTISFLHAVDLLYILITYIVVFLVRGIMVGLFYPLLCYTGKGCSPREAIFLVHGGLRGAVSVALALSLVHSTARGQTTIDLRVARTVFFLAGGVATLTLLINATTAGIVLKKLSLLPDDVSATEVRIMRHYAQKRIRLKALDLLEQLQSKYPDNVDPQVVWQYCSIFQSSNTYGNEDQDIEKLENNTKSQAKASWFSCFFIGKNCGNIFCKCFRSSKPHNEENIFETHSSNFHEAVQIELSARLSWAFPSLERKKLAVNLPPSFLASVNASCEASSSRASGTYEELIGRKMQNIAQVARSIENMFPVQRRLPMQDQLLDSGQSLTNQLNRWNHRFGLQEENTILEEEGDHDIEEVKMSPISSQKSEYIFLNAHKKLEDQRSLKKTSSFSYVRQQDGSLVLKRNRSMLFSATPSTVPETKRSLSQQPICLNDAAYVITSPTLGAANNIEQDSSVNINSSVGHDVTSCEHEAGELREEILSQIRRAFLEIVRVHYWRQIRSGRLPRKSQTISILLNSIDYALERSHTSGLDDWSYMTQFHFQLFRNLTLKSKSAVACEAVNDVQTSKDIEGGSGNDTKSDSVYLKQYLDSTSPDNSNSFSDSSDVIRIGQRVPFDSVINFYSEKNLIDSAKQQSKKDGLDLVKNNDSSSNMVTSTRCLPSISNCFDKYESKYTIHHRNAQIVQLLIAFLEAHEYAQKKIRFYVGVKEGIKSSDEEIVLDESRALVETAKKLLSCIDPQIVTQQLSKQAARWILHMQEDAIVEFREEGVITGNDAEAMLNEIDLDRKKFSSNDNGDDPRHEGFNKKCTSYYYLYKGMFWIRNALNGVVLYFRHGCR